MVKAVENFIQYYQFYPRFATWKIRRLNQLNSTNFIWVDPSIKFDRSGVWKIRRLNKAILYLFAARFIIAKFETFWREFTMID